MVEKEEPKMLPLTLGQLVEMLYNDSPIQMTVTEYLQSTREDREKLYGTGYQPFYLGRLFPSCNESIYWLKR
jgi:hypothetical protein